MARKHRLLFAAVAATALVAAAPSAAPAAVPLSGTFQAVHTKQNPDRCADPNFVGECDVFQLAGYGAALYEFEYGPTFEQIGDTNCYLEDGTFTLTLLSDGSTISGPLTGTICWRWALTAADGQAKSYGNPFREQDTITFTDGTGQFAGLTGTATFTQFSAGALYRGTLNGTLS